jgi:hypothetical protein
MSSFGNFTDAQCPVNIPGFVHHGNCNLLCRPGSWITVIVFYLGNYVAHAATTTVRPGERHRSSIIILLVAILFPGAGVTRGMEAILSLAKFAKSELQMAARAGALLTVIKSSNVDAFGLEHSRPGASSSNLDDTAITGTYNSNKNNSPNSVIAAAAEDQTNNGDAVKKAEVAFVQPSSEGSNLAGSHHCVDSEKAVQVATEEQQLELQDGNGE